MSTIANDFQKYALSNGISSFKLDRFNKQNSIINPYIVEERTGNPLQIDIFSKLFTDRILFLGAPIYEDVGNIINCQLLYMEMAMPSEPVKLYINSPGGSIYDGLSIYDTMNHISCPIHTTCMGLAASMASIILTAGEKGNRMALPHSRILVHQPMSGIPNGTQASDIEIANKEIQILKKELISILCEHSGVDYEKMKSLCDRDTWLTSTEAMELGLIDKVIIKS